MKPQEFAWKVMQHGARGAYWVGGCVRDEFLGIVPQDHDILVEGISQEGFKEIFPDALMTGKKFPVYHLEIDGERMEIAFARREQKTAAGHGGYDIDFSPQVTLEEDLFRRDLTINAMAKDILTGKVIDPFLGLQDIQNKKIRAVSEHFKEDAVRALRAARLAAIFAFDITEDTIWMMHACREELRIEPIERILHELEKALSAPRPSIYFRHLAKAGILDTVHPEIFRLIGQSQPEQYHPEGDAFEHSMMVLDAVAGKTKDIKTRFAALFHDIGKGITPKECLPKHHGHDAAGVSIIQALPTQYKKEWKKAASFVAKHHMRVHTIKHKGKIVRLYEEMRRSSGLPMQEFCHIIEADQGMKPGMPWFLDADIMDAVLSAKIETNPGMPVEQIKQRMMHKRICVLLCSKKGKDKP